MAQRVAKLGTKLVTKSATSAQRLAVAASPHLKTFWRHARVELGPPGLSEWPAVKAGLGRLFTSTLSGKFLDVSMKQATKNTIVAVEVVCWFFVGEMIGRRSIVGYKV